MAPSRQDAFAVAQPSCGRSWVTLDPERQREVATRAERQARAGTGAAATRVARADAACRWAWQQADADADAGADDEGGSVRRSR